jgi:hypothetical protein
LLLRLVALTKLLLQHGWLWLPRLGILQMGRKKGLKPMKYLLLPLWKIAMH